jgi:hypothetical protein
MQEDESVLLARLHRSIEEGRIRLTLDRRKLSHMDFPLSFESDGNRWIYPIVGLTALGFWLGGVWAGIAIGGVGYIIYQTLGRAYIVRRLDRRIRAKGLISVAEWRKIWRFGGVVLTSADGETRQGPHESWMGLVRGSTVSAEPVP